VKHFMLTVSQLYAGLELPTRPAYSTRTWNPHVHNSLNPKFDIPSLTSKELTELSFAGKTDGHTLLRIPFCMDEIKAILKHIHNDSHQQNIQVLSQDAIVAYILHLYNDVIKERITKVRFILNVRPLNWLDPNNLLTFETVSADKSRPSK
jgi:hypothetical protein